MPIVLTRRAPGDWFQGCFNQVHCSLAEMDHYIFRVGAILYIMFCAWVLRSRRNSWLKKLANAFDAVECRDCVMTVAIAASLIREIIASVFTCDVAPMV
jgi:hypothetical protein